jgi:hypothetical protein
MPQWLMARTAKSVLSCRKTALWIFDVFWASITTNGIQAGQNIACFHPETPDVKLAVSNSETHGKGLALNSIVLEFPDGNQLADIVDTSLVMPR